MWVQTRAWGLSPKISLVYVVGLVTMKLALLWPFHWGTFAPGFLVLPFGPVRLPRAGTAVSPADASGAFGSLAAGEPQGTQQPGDMSVYSAAFSQDPSQDVPGKLRSDIHGCPWFTAFIEPASCPLAWQWHGGGRALCGWDRIWHLSPSSPPRLPAHTPARCSPPPAPQAQAPDSPGVSPFLHES